MVQAGWFRCPCAPSWPRPGFVSRSLLHTHSLGGAFIYCHSLLSPTLQWRVFSGLIAFFGKGECLFPTVWAAIWICLLMGGGRGERAFERHPEKITMFLERKESGVAANGRGRPWGGEGVCGKLTRPRQRSQFRGCHRLTWTCRFWSPRRGDPRCQRWRGRGARALCSFLLFPTV